jgi:hypothetical protein
LFERSFFTLIGLIKCQFLAIIQKIINQANNNRSLLSIMPNILPNLGKIAIFSKKILEPRNIKKGIPKKKIGSLIERYKK